MSRVDQKSGKIEVCLCISCYEYRQVFSVHSRVEVVSPKLCLQNILNIFSGAEIGKFLTRDSSLRVHPSICYLAYPSLWVAERIPAILRVRQGKPWTSCQLIAGQMQRQPTIHNHTHAHRQFSQMF